MFSPAVSCGIRVRPPVFSGSPDRHKPRASIPIETGTRGRASVVEGGIYHMERPKFEGIVRPASRACDFRQRRHCGVNLTFCVVIMRRDPERGGGAFFIHVNHGITAKRSAGVDAAFA